jgi:hypothetical protein
MLRCKCCCYLGVKGAKIRIVEWWRLEWGLRLSGSEIVMVEVSLMLCIGGILILHSARVIFYGLLDHHVSSRAGSTEAKKTRAKTAKAGRVKGNKKCAYLWQDSPPVIPHRRLVVRQQLVASRTQDNLVVNVGNIYLRSRSSGLER